MFFEKPKKKVEKKKPAKEKPPVVEVGIKAGVDDPMKDSASHGAQISSSIIRRRMKLMK